MRTLGARWSASDTEREAPLVDTAFRLHFERGRIDAALEGAQESIRSVHFEVVFVPSGGHQRPVAGQAPAGFDRAGPVTLRRTKGKKNPLGCRG